MENHQNTFFRGIGLRLLRKDYDTLVEFELYDRSEAEERARDFYNKYIRLFDVSEEHPEDPLLPAIAGAFRTLICSLTGINDPGGDVDVHDLRYHNVDGDGDEEVLSENDDSEYGNEAWEQYRRERDREAPGTTIDYTDLGDPEY